MGERLWLRTVETAMAWAAAAHSIVLQQKRGGITLLYHIFSNGKSKSLLGKELNLCVHSQLISNECHQSEHRRVTGPLTKKSEK